VDCQPASTDVKTLTVSTYRDARSLQSAWQASQTDTAAGFEMTADACADAQPGRRAWGFGEVVCEIDGDTARVSWTDRRTATVNVAEGPSADIKPLYQWWRSTGRTLGRGGDALGQTPEATPEPTPRPRPTPEPTPTPLVRTKAEERVFTCSPSLGPIVDANSRTWHISTVQFRNRGGYERVVINLQPTGTNGPGQTKATVKRMDVSRLARAVPNAPRPRRGSTAIVVQLDGVKSGPNLRGYRPRQTRLSRELSVVPSDGGQTVIVTAPGDTCYRIRIPAWKTGARNSNAAVFVDLKPRQ
jgi:hypothetical protein